MAAEPGHCFAVMAYGDSPFLSGCLESVRAQGRPSELIVTTSTPSQFIEAAAKAAGATLHINPRRAGIAADWNFALRVTGAQYVTLTHQDDVYFPTYKQTCVDLLNANQDAVLAFTGYEEIDDAGQPVSSRISIVKHALETVILGTASKPTKTRIKWFLSFGNPLPCSSVTFNRRRLGDFEFSHEFRSNLDWDAWLRLAEQGEVFVRSPRRLVGRRHNSLTETANAIREGVRHREDLAIFRRLWVSPFAEMISAAYRLGYAQGK